MALHFHNSMKAYQFNVSIFKHLPMKIRAFIWKMPQKQLTQRPLLQCLALKKVNSQ